MTELRLADGVIVSIGFTQHRLVDLRRGRLQVLPVEVSEALELFLNGQEVATARADLEPLVADGFLVPGTPGPDPIVRERLATLGRYYLAQYESTLTPRARAAYEMTLDAHAWRKRFLGRVGQCPVLPETALRRALLVGDAEVVGKKRVLCFGDDDFVSVPLAALGHDVTIIDVDEYLLSLVTQVKSSLGLDISMLEYDARDPVPSDVVPFDCFVTDPMSNRACFELFLSRALALLAPEGEGFIAVYAPTTRLFAQIAGEMRFEVASWWRNHNKYYSPALELHPSYMSDWTRVRKTAATTPRYAADELALPEGLYRDDYTRRQATLLTFYEEIDTTHAFPLFLDLVLDALAEQTGLRFTARYQELEQSWSVLHGATADGYVTLHVDRDKRQLTLSLHPFTSEREQAVRNLVVAGFKHALASASVVAGFTTWDLRVR